MSFSHNAFLTCRCWIILLNNSLNLLVATRLLPPRITGFGRAIKKDIMRRRSKHDGSRPFHLRVTSYLASALILSSQIPSSTAIVYPSNHELHEFDHLGRNPELQTVRHHLNRRDNPIPLKITNSCGTTIWPGIATQHGDRPESSGFELAPGTSRSLSVGPTWQGRIWGRTNCTVSGGTASCATGDCFGQLECEFGGAIPATLAEFNLAGGTLGRQTFYDISLVDGYNLPIGVVYIPAANTTEIPPNLVNAACIATTGYLMAPNRTGLNYTNSSYPMPYETAMTNANIGRWCPWDLQAFPPDKPGDGVYPYPDDNIERPIFNPCKSACAATGHPEDCCTGDYDTPNTCKPGLYSIHAKNACPDAYSYAYDDIHSTFIIPSGGGWEVVFCPAGRSTNILATFSSQLTQLASTGEVTKDMQDTVMNLTYIESVPSTASGLKLSSTLVMVAVTLLFVRFWL